MAIAPALLLDIEMRLDLKIGKIATVSGGSINQVYHLVTTKGEFLIKINSASLFPYMFRHEQEGLMAIAATNTLSTPKVIDRGEMHDDSYLLLEWIETQNPNASASKFLGEALAAMHTQTAPQFGFDTNNYMGSFRQSNTWHSSWPEFFIEERLMPMVEVANQSGALSAKDNRNFERLYSKLADILPDEPPSLVHGDLWSGNYLIDTKGRPYLIDPAVSYSSREFDIAMTTLFGGFDPAFYQAYDSTFPLIAGWPERLALHNLYPLLLHLNLFGGSYLNQVRQCVAKYL